MTDESPRRNSFRAAVLRGERKPLVLDEKQPRLEGCGDALDGVLIPRSESRRGNHRDQDRHRLTGETAIARHEGQAHEVTLVNLSAGGAMIEGDFPVRLWDLIELELGEGSSMEAAVRWVKDGHIGLEFAHETKIECDPKERAALLLEVIQRSFPDVPVHLEPTEDEEEVAAPEDETLGNRTETRHPLIWSGEVHYAFDSNPVRLRNISSGGVLVDVATDYPVGAKVLLDLGEAGQFDAVVSWACGDQAGLRFSEPFDLNCLARAQPQVAPHRWTPPTFLDDSVEEDTPWSEEWSRSSISALRSELEGFLKH